MGLSTIHAIGRLPILCFLTLPALSVAGSNIDQFGTLMGNQFDPFSKRIVNPIGYNAKHVDNELEQNFQMGFLVSETKLKSDLDTLLTNSDGLNGKEEKTASSTVYMPKFQLSTGVNGLNIGAFYSTLPERDLQIYGGELSFSMLRDNYYTPELSVRGTYSQLVGVEDMAYSSTGLELAISKGFKYFTPYAGVGTTWVDSYSYTTGPVDTLTQTRYFMGLSFNLGLMTFSAETTFQPQTETTEEDSSANANFNFKF